MLGACGTATREQPTPTGAVVVSVGANSLTKTALGNWVAFEAVLQHAYRPNQPVPPGLIPDPPAYRECIAYLGALAASQGVRPKPHTDQRRRECQQERVSLERQTLGVLIDAYWVREEAAARHVLVGPAEVERDLRRVFLSKRWRFPPSVGAPTPYERFVVADRLLLAKLQRRTLPIYARLRHARHPESLRLTEELDAEIQRLANKIASRWTPRTHCQAGYVVSECSEYHTLSAH
jgi:hypothetical protein